MDADLKVDILSPHFLAFLGWFAQRLARERIQENHSKAHRLLSPVAPRSACSSAHVKTCRLKPTLIATTRAGLPRELLSSHVNRNGCKCASEYVFPSELVCGLHRIKPA